jgi:putative membrane protein
MFIRFLGPRTDGSKEPELLPHVPLGRIPKSGSDMKTAVMAASALILVAAAAPATAKNPKAFISDAIKGDNSEIMLGRLAERAARNEQVKDFGHTLVADHTKAKQQAVKVARELGVTPFSHAALGADAEYAKLQVLSGELFDKEFVKYMVRDHQDDIAAFQSEADGDKGPVGALARKQLPTLNKHLELAQSLAAGDKSAGR